MDDFQTGFSLGIFQSFNRVIGASLLLQDRANFNYAQNTLPVDKLEVCLKAQQGGNGLKKPKNRDNATGLKPLTS